MTAVRKRRKLKRKKKVTLKERRQNRLRGSEWILVGVLFVAISEFIVKYYGLNWRFMPYAAAVWMVLIFRILFKVMIVITKGLSYLLTGISDLDYKR